MTQLDLLSFSMRSEAPQAGADWFRIVRAKKGGTAAKVYIYDEIGFWGTTAKDFAAQLNEIDEDEIELHLNSPGGSVFDGLAIMAALKNHKATINAVVDGLAASAASFILQAADSRKTTRNAQIMIHDAKAFAGGNAEQMRKAADLLDRVSDNIADIYAVRSGQGTLDSWRALMKAGDEWYSGNEALDAGLVDEVIDNPDEDEDEPDEASNSWSAEEVEAFLRQPVEKLAASASQLSVTNRVEEAQMTGSNPQNNNDKPTSAAPPAAPTPPTPQASAPHAFMVNGAEVTDFSAVQAHIASLESFRSETIEAGRKDFVKKLVDDGKLSASAENVSATEAFALSLTGEQFTNWKATMEAAPSNALFGQHGVAGGQQKPANSGDTARQERISVLQDIVQGHRDSGVPEDKIVTKASYKELQALRAEES